MTIETEPLEGPPPVAEGEAGEHAAQSPPRKRGRRTNAEYLAAGQTPPPPSGAAGRKTSRAAAPGRRGARGAPTGRRGAAEYAKSVDDVLALVQAVAGMRDPVAAEIIGDGRPNLSRAVGNLAASNDVVSALLDRLGTSSELLDVVIAAGAIALPLAAHYGALNSTPLAGMADPYRQRVAMRQAAAAPTPAPEEHAAEFRAAG
jgi:hypothetical protein